MVAAMIVKQLDLFEKVDVFRIVKDMRDYREGMLHDVVRDFVFLASLIAIMYFAAIFCCSILFVCNIYGSCYRNNRKVCVQKPCGILGQ